MTFLTPYWLFAASAILLPIAIHLWNKRQGKTVKVGSIRWLEASASKQWSQVRLSDVWLLLLRCLILIVLAMALAKPVLDIAPGTTKGKKVIYIAHELLHHAALQDIRPTVDNLLSKGYTLHAFTPAFTPITAEHWEQINSTAPDTLVENGNYWQLLTALAEKHPHQQDSVWLFTSDQQRHFAGPPTTVQENITWLPVALQQPTEWLQAAYQTEDDSIRVIAGQSTREGTTFKKRTISTKNTAPTVGSLQLQLQQRADSISLIWGKDGQHTIPVQQKPIQIQVVASEQQQAELTYLRAAIAAISNYTAIPVAFEKVNTAQTIDWLFWLSDAEIPDSVWQLTEQGMHLWVQPGTNPTSTSASLITSASPVQLYQFSTQPSEQGQIIWSATNGAPLLTAQPQGNGIVYHFGSGFSPEWSRLGQNPQLPEMLLPLILHQPQSIKYDARALPESLLKPERTTALSETETPEETYNLLRWFVLLGAVLFLIERIISSKRAKV